MGSVAKQTSPMFKHLWYKLVISYIPNWKNTVAFVPSWFLWALTKTLTFV